MMGISEEMILGQNSLTAVILKSPLAGNCFCPPTIFLIS